MSVGLRNVKASATGKFVNVQCKCDGSTMMKRRYSYRTRVHDDKCKWKANDDSVYASERMRGVTERDGRMKGLEEARKEEGERL